MDYDAVKLIFDTNSPQAICQVSCGGHLEFKQNVLICYSVVFWGLL